MENKQCFQKLLAFRCVSVALVIFLFTLPARAANNCPWMNEATASGLLGGTANGEFQQSSVNNSATCVFTNRESNITRTLLVRIENSQNATERLQSLKKDCRAAATPLQAIGNEAASCPTRDQRMNISETVIGRVRNQVFLIEISSSATDDPVLNSSTLGNAIHAAAEQVTGNLF